MQKKCQKTDAAYSILPSVLKSYKILLLTLHIFSNDFLI